jgi:hypothetical protein
VNQTETNEIKLLAVLELASMRGPDGEITEQTRSAITHLLGSQDMAFGLDAQGLWHGPTPPSEGNWVEVGRGPKGGKVWRQSAQQTTPPGGTQRGWTPKPSQQQHPQMPQQGAAPGSPAPSPRQEVVGRIAKSPFKESQEIGEGKGKNASYIITLESGDKGVWKPAIGEEEGLKWRVGGDLYRREIASSALADVLGIGRLIPPTIFRNEQDSEGSLQLFIKNAAQAYKVGTPFGSKEDLEDAAAFDFFALNLDRHNGNWLVSPGEQGSWRPYLIDNGLTFPDNHTEYASNKDHCQILHAAIQMKTKIPERVADWGRQRNRVAQMLQGHGLGSAASGLALQRFDLLVRGAQEGKTFAEVWLESGIQSIPDLTQEAQKPGQEAQPAEEIDMADMWKSTANE